MAHTNQVTAFGELLQQARENPVATFDTSKAKRTPRLATEDGVLVELVAGKVGFFKGEIPRVSFEASREFFLENCGAGNVRRMRRRQALRSILRLMATGQMAKDIADEANELVARAHALGDLNQKLKDVAEKVLD